MALPALRRQNGRLGSELLASPPLPPLEWQYLGVIYGTTARGLKFSTWGLDNFPQAAWSTGGEGKGQGGWGGGEQSLRVGLVRARTALAAGTLLQAPPRGVSEARVGHTLGGEMPSQA